LSSTGVGEISKASECVVGVHRRCAWFISGAWLISGEHMALLQWCLIDYG